MILQAIFNWAEFITKHLINLVILFLSILITESEKYISPYYQTNI